MAEVWCPLTGNKQKKASAMIEASRHKMIAVGDFDLAARTVSPYSDACSECME